MDHPREMRMSLSYSTSSESLYSSLEEEIADASSTFLEKILRDNNMGEQEPEFEWDSRRPHPMCIPHIVDTVLDYMGTDDLKTIRLVNSQYNEIACRKLAQKEVITFNKISQLDSYLSTKPIAIPLRSHTNTSTNENENDDLYHYEQAWNSLIKFRENDNKPDWNHYLPTKFLAHNSYHFNFDPEDNDPEALEMLEDFFENVGPQITKMHFTTDLIPLNFPKRLPHMGDIWKGRVPNLETLSLEIKWGVPAVLFENGRAQGALSTVRKLILDIVVTERDAERAAIFLHQLLSATPHLEEISIPGNKKFFDDYINVLLGRVILSLDLPRLSTLNFCLALNPMQMLELAQKKFPLKSLILDFADVHHFTFPNQNLLFERALYILFSETAHTLRSLHLCFPYNPEHPLHRFTFPEPMRKLKYLALGRFYGSVSILDNLPVIKKLDLWSVRFHDFRGSEDEEEDENQQGQGSRGSLENCQEFVVPVPEHYLSITTVIS